MPHPLKNITRIEQDPRTYLNTIGTIFATFGAPTQDSGNISYGIRAGADNYFVKTPGAPDDPLPKPKSPSHADRVAMLRNAVRLHRAHTHPALPRLHQVIESPHGPLLVYEWVNGSLIRTEAAMRNDPRSPYQRFRNLPVPEILRALDSIYDLHHGLAQRNWIAVDFYDGCLIYDFKRQQLRIVDLDNYHEGSFTNTMGRMFGSTRFMAPEEFELGAPIDERTTVFTMGRTAALFLSDGTLDRTPFRGSDALYAVICRACRENRDERFPTVAEFHAAWTATRDPRSHGDCPARSRVS